MRNVPGKRDHRPSFRIENPVAEREARRPFQYEEIFVLVLMDMQRRAVAGVRNNLDERVCAVGIGRRYAYQATFARSRLQPFGRQLLNDVRSRKIDVIVVYKVDRLTRSLADFAKLVELFDASDGWDRDRAHPAVGEGFPILLFRLQ